MGKTDVQAKTNLLYMKEAERDKDMLNDIRLWLILICLVALLGFIAVA